MFPGAFAFISIRILDVIDILLVAFLLYQAYRLIKGTVAISILAGIFLVYLVWLLVRALNMELIGSILGQVMAVGVIALIIVFQQEIRRFLLLLGSRYRSNQKIFPGWLVSFGIQPDRGVAIGPVVEAALNFSKSKTGALIVIARESELQPILETGDLVNADISSRLLETIFFKNNPLHDGAVVIVKDKIVAARCILPPTENIYLPANYGMRHRAALGMSEKTDALVVLVSEETGKIGYAREGELTMVANPEELRQRLEKDCKGLTDKTLYQNE